MSTIHVDVVSAEELIFSGEATFVALPGEAGELGIYPRHTPLISRIRPGSVRIHTADGGEEFVFVAGGILEVQPDCVTVMSDTAVRGKDMDEEKANAAKLAAEEAVKNAKSDVDMARARSELTILAARVPNINQTLARQIVVFVQELRRLDLFKIPGVAETIDWANALVALNTTALTLETVDDTLGAILKYQDDLQQVKGEAVKALLARVNSL